MSDDNVVVLDSAIEQTLNFDGLRLLAVLRSKEAETSVTKYLSEFDGVDFKNLTLEEFEQQGITSDGDMPDILIMEVKDEADGASWIKAIRAEEENELVHICLLMKSPTKTATVNLLRLGADDILSLTPNDIELSSSLARSVSHRAGSDGRLAQKPVRTIVFIHASGGAGATTLAVNSAIKMHRAAKVHGGKACLLDLDMQFGDADLQLDLPMRSNLIDLIKSPDRLDFRMLENLMVEGPEGLRVLTAPEEPLPMEAISKKTIEHIISLARRHYRYVIIDMPISLTSWTDSILRRADRIFLVTQVNVVALRSARRLIDTLHQENLGEMPISGIANRYPSRGPGRKITISEVEKALRIPIKKQIPNDYSLLINSLDQGLPASMKQEKTKYTKTLDNLLESFTEISTDKKAKKFGGSFLNFGGSNV
ncbi:MAG: pilus assembly protein CpaE [Hyphococcus sp.]|nr:MAG: pilus assembly protein CpaE [Marinicaulis sp.]